MNHASIREEDFRQKELRAAMWLMGWRNSSGATVPGTESARGVCQEMKSNGEAQFL